MGDPVVLPLDIGSGGECEMQTLFADSWRRLVLVRLRHKAVLAAPTALTPLTIQCVVGSGVLHVEAKTYSLTPGVIVPVDAHSRHSVVAEPEVAVLMTFFHQPSENSIERGAECYSLEKALQETEERYRALVENARDVIFTLTPDGVFTSLNSVFEEAVGWPAAEWIGKSFLPLLHAEDVPLALGWWRRILQGEAPSLFELRLSPKSGEPVLAELLVTPQIKEGKVVSVLGIARNVTERKREEDARRRAESAEAAQRVLEKEIAERKRVEGKLRHHLAVEEALVRASQLFTSADEPDLTQLLGLLGETVKADHAYIFLLGQQGDALSITHEWCNEETVSWSPHLLSLNPTDFPWVHAQLDKGEPVLVPDVGLLPAEVRNEKLLKKTPSLRSLLLVPIRSRTRQMIGFLGFEALTTKRVWSNEEVRLLSVVSEMLSCSFARKVVEDALRAAERDYRALFENAVEGIYRSTLDGRQLRANPALVKLNGYNSEEEMLPAVNDIATEWYVNPHRREEFKRMLEREGTVTDFESEIYRHKTRERIWISETARLVRDAQGSPLYYEGTVQDITARKLAENALREREARLTAVFRAVNDVTVTFDLDETITGVNRAIERVFGYKPEEVLGKPSVVLVTPEGAALARARTVRAWRGESLPALFEVEGVHKDGRRIPLEASASFLYEGDKPVGLVSVLRDISLKKELERQRADFLAMLTHDIKNPMHVILGCSELLSEEFLTEEQHTLLQRLRSNALTVHSLVTNYLDLSKIESGHLILRTQPLLINTLLRQVSQQYAAETERRDLVLHLQLQDDLPLVEGDPLALERVFANLLHNAIKFTPRFGQITIHSALRDNSVVVRIADSGPGIALEELASLFEKYRQAKEGRTTEGAGLGLFIVRALVEAHGGQVEAESIPGQGACFSVFLPMTSFSSCTTV